MKRGAGGCSSCVKRVGSMCVCGCGAGGALSRHVSNVFCLGVGISAAFYFSWILALVSFSTVPFMVIASVIQLMIMQGAH